MKSPKSILCLGLIAKRSSFLTPTLNRTLSSVQRRHAQTAGFKRVTTSPPVNKDTAITNFLPSSHRTLKVSLKDETTREFLYIWLRDNCQCSSCVYTDGSREKFVDTVSIDMDIKPQECHLAEDGKLHLLWPDGHVTVYDAEWLCKNGNGFDSSHHGEEKIPPVTTWDSETIVKLKPEASYAEVMGTEEGLKEWIQMLHQYGIGILRGVPCEKGQVLKVMERTAYVRNTSWGKTFDVICEPVQSDPNHLAYTGMELDLHTDMNFLEKSPGLQALHCLKNKSSNAEENFGGKSVFVDGFYIANWLRKQAPYYFYQLASTLVKFQIHSHNLDYSNHDYVFRTNKDGSLHEVHYNTRTMAPLRGSIDNIQSFYEAYKLLAEKTRQLESQFTFNLEKGDLVLFNNRRILHGRTSFDSRSMLRHLEGCYGDLDELITRYKSIRN